MHVFDKVRLVIYRVHEKGIEVFLTGTKEEKQELVKAALSPESWQMLATDIKTILLDPIEDPKGETIQAVAIEADWHEIPSVRNLIKRDLHIVKSKFETILPEAGAGSYVLLKEAFKKTLPYEYAWLKELKEVLVDRNLVKNI